MVTNARTPGARCYGYVTMSSSEDAAKCIQHLHRTELHGRVISVEKVNYDCGIVKVYSLILGIPQTYPYYKFSHRRKVIRSKVTYVNVIRLMVNQRRKRKKKSRRIMI